MFPKSRRQKKRNDALAKLNEATEDLNRAKEASNITPVKAVFGSTSALLPTIRVSSMSIHQLLANLRTRIRRPTGRVISN